MTDWKEDYKKRMQKITNGGKKNMTQIVVFLDDNENKIVNLYKIQNNHISKQDAIREIIRNQRVQIDTAENVADSVKEDSGDTA